jgi:hypothetical protein
MSDLESVLPTHSASQLGGESAIAESGEESEDDDSQQSVTPSSLVSIGSYFIVRNNRPSLAEAQKLINKSKAKVVLLYSLLILVASKNCMVIR